MTSCLRSRFALSAIACAGLAVAAHAQQQVKDPGVTLEDKYSPEQLAKLNAAAGNNDRPSPRGPGGGDEIAAASAIDGYGIFDFNLTAATTGTDGQDIFFCEFFSEIGVNNDVWFCWTAPEDEFVTLSTCGLTLVNTKVIIYEGCNAATIDVLNDCDDDSDDTGCNNEQTSVNFNVDAGQQYLIQIGLSPLSGAPGVGQFEIQPFGSGGGGSDECSDPALIAGVGTFPIDTTSATSGFDFLPAGCNDFVTIDNDVWYCWTPDERGRYSISTCGADFDTRIAVFQLCTCPPIDDLLLGCNDDAENCGAGSDQSEVLIIAEENDEILIRVGGADEGDFGTGDLTIALVEGSGDDECDGAAAISGTGEFFFDNNFASTGFDGQANAACDAFGSQAINNDIWYCWTAATDSVVRIETCDGTTLDTKIAVYDGCDCGGIENRLLDCNDDACALQSRVQFAAVAGQSYLIQFGTFADAAFGDGTFTIEEFIPVENDECFNPTVIEGQGTFGFDNITGSTGFEGQFEAPCANVENDVWYCWTSDHTGMVSMQTCGLADFDTNIAVYDGCACDNLLGSLVCNDDACALQSRVVFDVVEGNQYLLQVGTFSPVASGTGSFEIEAFIPAMNDDCSNPDMIEGAGIFGFDTTTASTGTDGQGNAECEAFGSDILNNDVWFCWTAPASGNVTVQTCGLTTLDTRLAVYDGCACENLSARIMACNDDQDCLLQSFLQFDAISGQQYLIQLGSFGAAQNGTGDFQIDIVETSGACCIDNVCMNLFEGDCLAQGGTFLVGAADCTTFDYTLEAGGAAFEDISATGTQELLLADNSGVNVDIGFDFNFYGQIFNNVDISDNGYLTFNGTTNIAINSDLGVDTEPNNLIAPLWDDFDPRFCGSLHTELRGTAPDRRFIVQYTDWSEFDFIAGLEGRCGDFLNTFQVVLHENFDIEFRYADITEQRIEGDYTVGVEDGAGLNFQSINAVDVMDNTSFTIAAVDPARICDDPVEPDCICELDGDDARVSVGDLLVYLDVWLANDPAAELNTDGEISVQDLLIFLQCYLDAQLTGQICMP